MAGTGSFVPDYTPPVYEPPSIVQFVGELLKIPIESRSTSFTDFFSNDRQAQAKFIQGMFGLACCFAGFAIFWFTSLLILKCKGRREAGCAAGYGFDNAKSIVIDDDDDDIDSMEPQPNIPQRTIMNEGEREEFNDEYDHVEYPNRKAFPKRGCHQKDFVDTFGYRHHIPSRQEIKILMALQDYDSDIARASRRLQSISPTGGTVGSMDEVVSSLPRVGFCSSHPTQIYKRRQRTRFAFFVCSILSIGCCAALWTHVRNPMKEMPQTMSDLFVEGHEIIDQVQSTLFAIEQAAGVADNVISTIPLNLTELCPDVSPELFENVFELNPRDVMYFLQEEFETFLTDIAFHIDQIQRIVWQVEVGLTQAGVVVEAKEDHLWLLSFWLLGTMTITVFAAIGVCVIIDMESKRNQHRLSRGSRVNSRIKRRSTSETRMEDTMSWVVLPTLIVFTVIGWCLLIAASLGTVITTDVCTAGSAPGTPDATVRHALHQLWDLNEDDLAYQKVVAYTEGCQGENPIFELIALEKLLGDNLEIMQQRLKDAHTVGLHTMKDRCGEGNHVDIFVTGVHRIAGQLEHVRESLGDVADTLYCPKINSFYSRTVHEVLCTDVASVSAISFVLLFVVCVSSMTLITLRASWRMSK